jgi:hypothetical protein
MSDKQSYKRFVSQFSVPEWKQLCKHRLFLHFLRTDLKIAASIAADALQRPVQYTFAAEEGAPKPRKAQSRDGADPRAGAKFRQRRFRL